MTHTSVTIDGDRYLQSAGSKAEAEAAVFKNAILWLWSRSDVTSLN